MSSAGWLGLQTLDLHPMSDHVEITLLGVPMDTDIVTIHLTNVPLDQALDTVLAASETLLLYTIQHVSVFVVTSKR